MQREKAHVGDIARVAPPHEALLLGHYGGSNTGDEAMLMSLMEMLPHSMNISIVTKDGKLGQHLKRNINALGPRTTGVLRAISRADIVILGGGTHFHDDYRGVRLLRHYLYLARYLAVFSIAKLFRKQVYYIGMGFGPFAYGFTKLISRCALAMADGISVRDRASFYEAKALGAGSKTVRAFDLAALLSASVTQETVKNKECLAVSVTDVPGIEGRIVNREKVLTIMTGSLRTLLSVRPEMHIKVIIVRGGARESDVEISELLVEALSEYSERVKLIPYAPDPVAILNEFRTSLSACVMRYHAGMLAYLAGCQLLFLPYHRKLVDLGHELGLSASACPPLAQLDRNILTDRLCGLMNSESTEFRPTLPVMAAKGMAVKNLAFWS